VVSCGQLICFAAKRLLPSKGRRGDGDHMERWVGSGLLVAERQFHKVQGYREIPGLVTSMANAVAKKAVAEEVKVA
jgi:hypothetical protein